MDKPNATVTVTYDGQSATFELDGDELSRVTQHDGSEVVYFTTASKDFIAEGVKTALLSIIDKTGE